ncbi:MAG TPA: DinB family protein [Pyrinomonadaceae bacterium]|jgi:uncharacterized damage-inducible protein DinB|nr:DinB family protein [Pyrinomonadaceae bacterium]
MEWAELYKTWEINQRINLYLLDSVAEENLGDSLVSKGRSVGEQFAHIHNVRLMWLKVALPETLKGPEALKGLEKIEKEQAGSKKLLQKSLAASAEAVTKLLKHALENDGKVKGFKPNVAAFLGYLIAHDAHHRSQIIIALKQSGHKVDQKIAYGIWEWGSR